MEAAASGAKLRGRRVSTEEIPKNKIKISISLNKAYHKKRVNDKRVKSRLL